MKIPSVIYSAVVVALTIAFASSASAAPQPTGVSVDGSGAVTMSGPAAATRSVTSVDPTCLQSTSKASDCKVEATTSVGAITAATPAQLLADASAKSGDGTSLAAAAKARTIYTRTFEQSQRGLYYINWVEKHIGRIYFDKAGHVWSTTSQYGYKGYHTCNLGSGIGYSVKVTSCSVENRYDLNGPAISLWDRYQVHVVAKGIPIYQSHTMHVNAYDGGTITFP